MEKYIGIVEDNNDPKKMGRCRVRILNLHDDHSLEQIPWATPRKDLSGRVVDIPENGKVVLISFPSGDKYTPEYTSAEHHNINLENKLKTLNGDDYTSMKSILFDHKTQMYVNDSEGLKLDYKYNNLNIQDKSINLNLKDNNASLNLGDETAGQQALLGNHWLDWFDEFVENLLGGKGGPFLGNLMSPVIPNPEFISVLMKYRALRDPKFLSHHVNIVDNNSVTTVKNTQREDTPQMGDSWASTRVANTHTSIKTEDFKPIEGVKQQFDPSYTPPITPPKVEDIIGVTQSVVTPPTFEQLSPEQQTQMQRESTFDDKVSRMIEFMTKKGFHVYEEPFHVNMLALRNIKKDSGEISNKFDDELNVFYKDRNGRWVNNTYQITTMAGFEIGTTRLPLGTMNLALGQYVDQCVLRKDAQKPYLEFLESMIYSNSSLDRYDFNSTPMRGKFPITINDSNDGVAENVYNYSKGEQVFKNSNQFNQFLSVLELQITNFKLDSFTYTIGLNSEYEKSYI